MGGISLADLQGLGVQITADEAVAIVQRLLHDQHDVVPEPPFGPPTLANVRLTDAGGVECAACEATPGVTEIAILLQAILARTPHVPGGLRYAIARALHDVDAPPFDSTADLSATLARYEPADRELVTHRLVQRAHASVARDGGTIDRRQSRRSADELRRELRDADRRFYETRIAWPVVEPPRRGRIWVAGAALGAVVVAVGAGGAMRSHDFTLPSVRPPMVPLAAPLVSPPEPDQIEPVIAAAPHPIHHAALRRPAHAPTGSRVARAFRFRWLRRGITVRDDLKH